MFETKPSIPKGTRDFGPEVMAKRNHIFEIIKATFRKFGFMQLETPAMENLNVLSGKYGDEGDQLLFKVLNSGDFLKKVDRKEISTTTSKQLLAKIAEKGFRYDLTVPFARYVAMNRGTLTFPFKRFQIQPVWRADRPQRGRYREFYQCDADVVGTPSLICESEIILMINEVFDKLGIKNFSIKINNRKILSAIAQLVGTENNESDLFVAIDKLDKIGIDKVLEELRNKGFDQRANEKIKEILSIKAKGLDGLPVVQKLLSDNETGKKGIEEINQITQHLLSSGLEFSHLEFDVTLARGLSYYTGTIFEVKVHDVKMGSVSGGGRYDNLTGVFGLPDVTGVGFSFGVDRIYDVLDELQLFPERDDENTQVLISNFDNETEAHGLGILKSLRDKEIKAEMYPSAVKLKKQLSYANKKNIPYVLLIGSEEIQSKLYCMKDLGTGKQTNMNLEDVILLVKNGVAKR